MPASIAVPLAVPRERPVDLVGAFQALAAGAAELFWLDAGARADDGWSFLGTGDRAATDDLRGLRVGGAVDTPSPAGPFAGGWVGWLGYEEAAAEVGAPVSAGGEVGAWIRARRWIALDHASGHAWAVIADDRTMEADAAQRAAAEWAREAERLLENPVSAVPEPREPFVEAAGRHTPLQYAALIGRCHDAIRAGDAYQLCLTTRFTVDTAVDPVEVYLRLRETSRTGRGAFLRVGELAVCSATPEQFLRVDAGVVRTRPIKGTRPRGADPIEDAALAAELLASEKERAENVMIVDLMRNDLARVSEPGSVVVDALLVVESYPHVHQLVSTVSGRLREGVTFGELLLRTFPAGSMTGAPKLSAMTILHELERGPRGVFAGCLGWVGDDGDLDLAMVIRTIVVGRERAYVGAGGGITWSSEAMDEVREVGTKARAPLAALGAALPPGW